MLFLLYYSLTIAPLTQTSIFRGVDDLDQDLEENITPGGNVKIGEFPGIAAVFNALSKFHTCTGVIIHERIVLTAGYCVSRGGEMTDPKYISVLAGVTDMRNRDDGQWRYAEVIIPSDLIYRNSIVLVLIKLNSPFYLNYTAKKIRLPVAPHPQNSFCKAITWRFRDRLSRLSLKSLVLKKYSVYVINQTACEKMYENNPIISGFDRIGFVCMKIVDFLEPGSMNYECVGNDGSLILCHAPGNLVPRGIAAGLLGGSSCNRMDAPYPFFDIGSFHEWIWVKLRDVMEDSMIEGQRRGLEKN